MTKKENNINNDITFITESIELFENSKSVIKNKNEIINECFKRALKMFLESKNKTGFFKMLFKNEARKEKTLFFNDTKKLLENNNIDFEYNVKTKKLFIETDLKIEDIENIQDLDSINEKERETKKEQKQKQEQELLNKNIDIDFTRYSIEQLKSIILKAKNEIKTR